MPHARLAAAALAGLVLASLAAPAARAGEASPEARKILDAFGRETGLFVVIGCGDEAAPRLATSLGANGNSLVHAIAGSPEELDAFRKAIAAAGAKGCVTAEQLALNPLPYRDYLVNVLVVMDAAKAKAAGLDPAETKRCLAPGGRLVTCRAGRVENIAEIPAHPGMDIWTHRYHAANGIPVSTDKVFDLPVGFKWNAGLPMNFDNPERSANRYSSTRALVVSDGGVFTFTTAVFENLGDGWRSKYGTDQYLTCRDAFNGRIVWRTKVGGTFYGGLYIENMAPLVAARGRLFTAGEDGTMLCIDAKTGKILKRIPTAHIPGVIAASGGTVVAATWKDGKVMGSIARYDRRRMDWEIDTGTVEAYDVESGEKQWSVDRLGTALLIDGGRVFLVSRSAKDPLEKNHNKAQKDADLKHPPQQVVALDLKSGKILWETGDTAFKVTNQAINLEAVGHGALAVAHNGRKSVTLLGADTGKVLDKEASDAVAQKFFRYRNHICTPVMRVNDIVLNNRGGSLYKPGMTIKFGGARAGCLTGTVPGYGAGYIPQNWCRCSPGQIPGLLAIAPIGTIPEPAAMEKPTAPVTRLAYDKAVDGVDDNPMWSTFRGNAERSSSAARDIPEKVEVAWTARLAAERRPGTLARDWRAYLNSRLTAAVVAGDTAIVGDIDHNEVVAFGVKDGKVRWRFGTGGRMDTAPTLYKRICLVADHTGCVSAIRAGTGELLYRLRIAPEERRMVSYGKVESVWPAIGGVMVADGVAYASAGRTQGSDGGLVVRAFAPETGKVLWSRALPQQGNGLIERTTKRNDTLVRHGDVLILMGHRLDLKTGEFRADPLVKARQEAVKAKEKELGRKLKRNERNAVEKGVSGGERAVQIGLEGLYSWNWTRLGHRKYQSIGYGGVAGDALSWNGSHAAACESRSGRITIVGIGESKKKLTAVRPADRQVTSLILCNNVLLVGGTIHDKDAPRGFVQALSLEDAKPVWEQTFDARLAFNGLAVDASGILASFDDGSVACLK